MNGALAHIDCGDGFMDLSLVAQTVKSLPAMRETRVRFLGREDPLEKEMTAHYSILAWEIPQTVEPGGLQSKGSYCSRTKENMSEIKVGLVFLCFVS